MGSVPPQYESLRRNAQTLARLLELEQEHDPHYESTTLAKMVADWIAIDGEAMYESTSAGDCDLGLVKAFDIITATAVHIRNRLDGDSAEYGEEIDRGYLATRVAFLRNCIEQACGEDQTEDRS